jgi:carbonic anhydrase
MAVVLSCIDSRTPTELVFDLGIGDVFSIRIAGNVAREKVLGSMEFGTLVAGAKLIVVMGHTSCGAVKAAVDLAQRKTTAEEALGCKHLDVLITDIQKAIDPQLPIPITDQPGEPVRGSYVDDVARRNVQRTMAVIRQESSAIDEAIRSGKLALVGGMYDVRTGEVSFFALDGGISERVLHARGAQVRPRQSAELPSSPIASE